MKKIYIYVKYKRIYIDREYYCEKECEYIDD